MGSSRWRTVVSAAVGMLAFAALLVPTFGFVLVAVPVVAFGVSERARRLVLRVDEPHRGLLATTALVLWLAGFVLFRTLVFDDGDNAYLLVGLLGLLMVPIGLVFAVAAALPPGRWRRRGAVAAIGLLWGACLYGVLATAASLAIIPSQDYPDNDVFLSHLLALGVMVTLLTLAFIAYRQPTRAR